LVEAFGQCVGNLFLDGLPDWLNGLSFSKIPDYNVHDMDWTNWQTYVALAVVLITLGGFVSRGLKTWLVGSDKDCCGGRCGCDVSKQPKRVKKAP